jgi:hypothetical protein
MIESSPGCSSSIEASRDVRASTLVAQVLGNASRRADRHPMAVSTATGQSCSYVGARYLVRGSAHRSSTEAAALDLAMAVVRARVRI